MNKVGLLAIGLSTCSVAAQSDPDYGINFVTIGDPGNRDTNEFEVPLGPDDRIGGVEYKYRMAITEVTVAQHLEFVAAYYPIYVKNTGSPVGTGQFTGLSIRAAFGQIHIRAGHIPEAPTDIGWEYAARYVNWLHNGKIIEEWAFESGVFDTSTFVQDDDGNWLHQEVHTPGARYRMPTANEWLKAAYWDPEKSIGEGGYWRYQNSSDIEPRPGLPSEGGERNAGEDNNDVYPLAVGSYPSVMSPWGVLDMAGGESEFFETVPESGNNRSQRGTGGSNYNNAYYDDIFSPDIIGYYVNTSIFAIAGFRLVSPSPAPMDLNADGRVNFFDVSIFIRWYINNDNRADLDANDSLDLTDIRIFIALIDN
ncbi:MAG: SUMF1/EgtB/PvdO family nonheme iron enzyme [Phycisphaerales bacterium]|nr:SUMF1/EgtB/PvdO family nonheme iron enzyme [Phycisphaerales bacterium]